MKEYTCTAQSKETPWMIVGWSHGHRSMTKRSHNNQQLGDANRQMIERSPTGVRTASRRCPFGRHNKIPDGGPWAAVRWPPGGRQETYEWIFVTSADHPANFNCELKCSGHRLMTWGWALQECLFGRPPPDFCRIWCKTHRTVIGRSIFHYCDVGIMSWVTKVLFVCTLRGNKVSMLTHTYPHKPLGKIKVAICIHQADSPLNVWPDVWSGDLQV